MFDDKEINNIVLVEAEMTNKITLNVFDFDNTLFRSPTPNPEIWPKKLIGKLMDEPKRDGLGWYQNPASLNPKYLDQTQFIESTVTEVKKSMNDPNAITVLLTGRSIEKSDLINAMVNKKGLDFDYRGFKTGGTTFEFKTDFIKNVISDLKSKGYETEFLNIWEDRESHVAKFEKLFTSLQIPHKVHFVNVPDWHMKVEDEKEVVKLLVDEYTKNTGKEVNLEKTINYYAVVLSEESRKKLISSVQIPEGWKVIAHHMTIVLPSMVRKDDEILLFAKENIDKEVSLIAKELGQSDKVMAVKVDSEVKSFNKIPHITVAIAPDGKTKDSNTITSWEPLPQDIELSGVVKAIY